MPSCLAMAQVIPLRPPSEDWLVRGAAAELEGRQSEAMLAFEQAVAADPGNVRAWYRLAEARARLGMSDAAEDAYHRVLELAQDHLPTWLGLGRLYGRSGRTKQQCFALLWLLMLAPDHVEARKELALALEARGEGWQAKRQWLKLLSQQPDGAEADLARRRLSEIREIG